MIHYIFNKKIIGLLIHHSVVNDGLFVLQIVNY
jgi:hypothetical protein